MTSRHATPEVSIVVPVFNEEGNIRPLLDEIREAMERTEATYEIVLVDDGSRDNTWEEITRAGVPELRALRFTRNFGHQHALFAGLVHSRGRAVVSLDGDLQHPPSLIPKMLERWRGGAKVVLTHRLDAPDTGLFKRVTSRWLYRVFSSLSGVEISPGSSDFRLLDRDVVEALREVGDVDPFLRGLVAWTGFPTETLSYQAASRRAGESKYRLFRMLKFASDGIVSFSTKPLQLSIWLSVLTGVASIAELLYVLYSFFSGRSVPGWASIVGVMTLLFSVVFMILGIMGLYLTSIHRSLQHRPRFLIHEMFSGPPAAAREERPPLPSAERPEPVA